MRFRMYIKEPMNTYNISPLQYKLTRRSDTVLSKQTCEIDKYDFRVNCIEDRINKKDMFEDDFWENKAD